jgi:hypothetical protein
MVKFGCRRKFNDTVQRWDIIGQMQGTVSFCCYMICFFHRLNQRCDYHAPSHCSGPQTFSAAVIFFFLQPVGDIFHALYHLHHIFWSNLVSLL